MPWLILALAAFLRFFLLGIKPPHFDEGINGWFVDQVMKNGFYRYDPTNYHGPLHFYVLLLFAEFVWTQPVGAAFACRAGEHRLCVACVEVRAVRRTKRQPNRGAGHGGLARVRFLRALRHSRSVAAILLDVFHFGAARFVEARHADLLVVRRRGINRHDPHEGNLRHSCRVRPACDSNSGSFVRAKPRSGRQACKANLELDRSRHDPDRRRICHRLFLFGNLL